MKEECLEFIKTIEIRRKEGNLYELLLIDNCTEIGWCKFIGTKDKNYKITFEIKNQYRDNGYGVEGVKLSLMDMCSREKGITVEAMVDEKNIPVWRTLEKVGFIKNGILFDRKQSASIRKYSFNDGV